MGWTLDESVGQDDTASDEPARHLEGSVSQTFIYTSVFKVREGKLEDYRAFTQRVAALVQEQEPEMIHFGIYLDPDTGEATTVQVHRSVDNFARHMDLVTPMMAEARELIDLSEMTIRIYGQPTEPILEQMRSLAGAGASVRIAQLAGGADHVG